MEKYQVFISFRGEDTRAKFTSYFHARLCQKKIETYIDYRLEKGEEISPALLRAIEESKISVVVFSENYAFSSWCLDELAHIMECKQKHGQIVVPVFYEVDPSHVRKQSNSYAAAMATLEGRFEDNVLRKWRASLTEAANIAGWDSRLYRLESEFVEAIVNDILMKLSHASASDIDFKDIIGIEQNVEQVESLLSIDSPNVVILGIWGMGGVGKTTLARVVFKRFSSQFEGCCFLANVREEVGKHSLDDLKVKLVSELLEDNGVNMVTSFVKDRLRRKKVLIILDDVNDLEQLEVLAGDHHWFGLGSRIIVTTRDAQVLRDRADEKYELKGLNFNDALKLFYLNAFRRSSPTPDDIKLSKRVVNYVEGIPLALKVLGSFLRSKKKENWDQELNKLQEVPNEKIHNVLKVSYDGLDKIEKSIFLDIACYFRGQVCRNYVECIIGGRGSFVDIGIDNLIDKCLVSGEDNNLVMHDLVREMGWEIVRQQSIEEPGERSRIWRSKDAYHIFKNNTGTAIVEGISLDTRDMISKVELSPTIFRRMYKLKLLNLALYYCPVRFPQGLQYLPDTLKCLIWFDCPLKSLPSEFVPHNLVELKMPHSRLEQLWNGVPNLGNLRYINLSYSSYLSELPDLSQALNLESIDLSGCSSLRKVPAILRFRVADKLTSLNQRYRRCDDDKCSCLGYLKLRGCSNLKIVPEILGTVKELHLGSTLIEELPSSICSLESLEHLDLCGCNFLKNLPSSIQKLKSLKYLNLNKCSSLDRLPDLPNSIVKLYLKGTAIEQLPSSTIDRLSCLEELYLSGCTRLVNLHSNICKLKSLKHITLSRCRKLKNFPEILKPMEHLKTLKLPRTGIRMLPSSIENLIGLEHLDVWECIDLEILPSEIFKLSCLQQINLFGCSKLERLPPLTVGLHSLTELNLSHCNISEIPTGIGFLVSLEKLILSRNAFAGVPESIKQLCKLVVFEICNCKNLKSLPELPLSLEFLDASGCMELDIISDSRALLMQGWWDDYNGLKCKEFFFYYDCLKLDQNMCNSLVFEFQIRSLHTATIAVSKHGELKESDYAHVSVCCPGKTIPKWFNHQSEASSINVKLPSCWHNNDFLGVALCAVVASSGFCAFEGSMALSCNIRLNTNHGKSRTFCWEFTKDLLGDSLFFTQSGTFNSKNMFMWYKYDNYLDWHDAVEVSFEFKLLATGADQYTDHYAVDAISCKVTTCAIRLLYLQDVEEFGIKADQYVLGNSNAVSGVAVEMEPPISIQTNNLQSGE